MAALAAIASVGTAVTIGAAALVATAANGADASSGPVHEDPLPDTVRTELAAEVAKFLETDPAGRAVVTTRPVPVTCAVRVLGTDPVGSANTEVAKVHTVYAWARCSTNDDRIRSGVSVPVAVDVGPAERVRQPQNGSYTESVRRIFPRRLQAAALNNAGYGPSLEPGR